MACFTSESDNSAIIVQFLDLNVKSNYSHLTWNTSSLVKNMEENNELEEKWSCER
jgi:hypothetical protein